MAYLKCNKFNQKILVLIFLFQIIELRLTLAAGTTESVSTNGDNTQSLPPPKPTTQSNQESITIRERFSNLISNTKEYMNRPSSSYSTGTGSCVTSSKIDPSFGCGSTESKVQVVQMWNMTSQMGGSMVVQSNTMNSQMAAMTGNTLTAMEAAKNAAQQAATIQMSMGGLQFLIAGSLARDISRHNSNQSNIERAASNDLKVTQVNNDGSNAKETEAHEENDAGYIKSSGQGQDKIRQERMLNSTRDQLNGLTAVDTTNEEQKAALIAKRNQEGQKNKQIAEGKLQDIAMYAKNEQQGIVDMAMGNAMMSGMMGSQQIMQGGSQMMAAAAMQHTIDQYKLSQARFINPVLPQAPKLSNPSYNAQSPAIINGTGNSSAATPTPEPSSSSSIPPLNLGNPFNTSGNNQDNTKGPTPGQFDNQASPNNSGGSNGSPSVGGSTAAAPPAKEDPPPKQVAAEKAIYQSAGGIMQPGGSGTRNSNEPNNPDLAKFLQALAPKDTAQNPNTGILSYDPLNGAQPYSPIAAERNLFEEVHKEYQSLQKENVIHGT